jgi:hypothetical protein
LADICCDLFAAILKKYSIMIIAVKTQPFTPGPEIVVRGTSVVSAPSLSEPPAPSQLLLIDYSSPLSFRRNLTANLAALPRCENSFFSFTVIWANVLR